MEDVSQDLDWSLLLPEFSVGLVDGTLTAQDLSAFVIVFFFVVTGVALAYLIIRVAAATRSVDFFLDILEGVSSEDVVAKRQAVRAAAQKSKHEGALWSRFDQTLVVSADGGALYSSQDCANIFNATSVAKDSIDNRLLAALPGLLTSLGILGTVVVLQLGLNNLPWVMAGGSSSVVFVDGVAVAFSTSVWGVVASVILQMAGQGSEWLLRWRIDYLRQRISRLFPRVGNSHMLVNLEHYDDQSEVTHTSLQTLVDGHMRNTLDAMAGDVQASMWQAMTPALDKLASVSDELAARRDASAVEAMVAEAGTSLGKLTASMAPMTEALDRKLDSYTALVDEHAASFQTQVGELAGQQQATMDKVDAALQATLEGAEQFVVHAGQAKQRDKATRELVQELDTARYNIENTVDELKRRAQLANKTLDQLEVGYTAFLEGLSESAADSGARMSNLLIDYSQQMSEQARERLSDWKQMSEEFSGAMSGALEDMRKSLQENQPAPPKKRPAARRKRTAAPRRVPKSD